jgi:hypothetical protein
MYKAALEPKSLGEFMKADHDEIRHSVGKKASSEPGGGGDK